jgi:hypothetical protein
LEQHGSETFEGCVADDLVRLVRVGVNQQRSVGEKLLDAFECRLACWCPVPTYVFACQRRRVEPPLMEYPAMYLRK